MIKRILLIPLFGLMALNPSLGQSLFTGKIVDDASDNTLPFVNVVLIQKGLGTTTNLEGTFNIFVENPSITDTLSISHVGYKTIKIACANFNYASQYTIRLKQDATILEEYVHQYKKFNLDSFVKTASDVYRKNVRKTPHVARAHSKVKIKYKNKFVHYSESIGYSIFMGELNVAPLGLFSYYTENIKVSQFSNECPEKINKQARDKPITPLYSNGTILNNFRRFELTGPLSKSYSDFKYSIDSSFILGAEHFYIISFKKRNQEGKIAINSTTYQVLWVDLSSIEIWNNLLHKTSQGSLNITFNYYNEQPFVSTIASRIHFDDFDIVSNYHVLSQKLDDFNINLQQWGMFNHYDINPFIQYNKSDWVKFNIANDAEWNIIEKDITNNKLNLEQQFIENSGKWYLKEDAPPTDALEHIKGLKKFF